MLGLMAVPMVVIAGALLAEGGGVIFSQPRVGRGQRRFNCLKFRTMRPDAERRLAGLLAHDSTAASQWRAHQKLCPDPRVTWLGGLLRQYSLDELPQLFTSCAAR